jgi:hypothetical protein
MIVIQIAKPLRIFKERAGRLLPSPPSRWACDRVREQDKTACKSGENSAAAHDGQVTRTSGQRVHRSHWDNHTPHLQQSPSESATPHLNSRITEIGGVAPVDVEQAPRRREAMEMSGRRGGGAVLCGPELRPDHGGGVERVQIVEIDCRRRRATRSNNKGRR